MEKSANGTPSGERSPSGKPWPRSGGCNTWQLSKLRSARRQAWRGVRHPAPDGGRESGNLSNARKFPHWGKNAGKVKNLDLKLC